MNLGIMPKLKIGNLEVDKPIIQGGMGVGISMSGLASAVTNAGGIGVISSIGLGLVNGSKDFKFRDENKIQLRKEIAKTRSLTNGVFGLNIMLAITDFDSIIKIAFEEEVDIVFLGAGLPLKLPASLSRGELSKSNTKTGVIVSSARAANIILRTWQKNFDHVPDIIIVEGPMAGGHLGFKKEQINDPNFSLENLVPQVVDVIKTYEDEMGKEIPVLAAGGIFTGADIFKFMDLGARGVQMGTRFVATHECDASILFKKAYLKCREEDISIIKSPVGLPGRAITNSFLEEAASGERKPFRCPWKCLKTCNFKESPYCIADALANAQKGILEEGFTFAGANAYRIDKIVSVKELIATLTEEFEEAAFQHVLESSQIRESLQETILEAKIQQ